MARLAVQVLEGARKVVTYTNAPFLATNWYVAKFQGELFGHLIFPPKRWISGKSSNRLKSRSPQTNKIRIFSTNNTKRVLHCDLPEVSIYIYSKRGSNTN